MALSARQRRFFRYRCDAYEVQPGTNGHYKPDPVITDLWVGIDITMEQQVEGDLGRTFAVRDDTMDHIRTEAGVPLKDTMALHIKEGPAEVGVTWYTIQGNPRVLPIFARSQIVYGIRRPDAPPGVSL